MTELRAPAGLGSTGGAMWRRVVAEYEVSTADSVRLEMYCRVVQRIADLGAIVARDGLEVDGKPHPQLSQLRADQRLADQMLSRLGLVDENGETVMSGWQARSRSATDKRYRSSRIRDELAKRRNAS